MKPSETLRSAAQMLFADAAASVPPVSEEPTPAPAEETKGAGTDGR